MKSPCKDCRSRTITCHAHCELYIDWQAEQARLKAITHDEAVQYVIQRGRENAQRRALLRKNDRQCKRVRFRD